VLPSEIFAVVSNYNIVTPLCLTQLFSDFVVFDQSDDPAVVHLMRKIYPSNAVFSPHVGHNLLDYLRFTIDNFENLPALILFGKGNMLTRHIKIEDLKSRLNSGVFAPIFSSDGVPNIKRVQYIDAGGWFCERNSDWYASSKRHRYFTTLDSMGNFLFKNWRSNDYITFSPGACYLIEGARLRNVGVETFECLIEILEYDFFPTEAYFVERILGGVFSLNLELKDEWKDLDNFKKQLNSLPDLSSRYVSGAGPLSGIKNFTINAVRSGR
jgi:hypothetical protein